MALALENNEADYPDLSSLFTQALLEIGRRPRPADGYIHASSIQPPGDVCLKRLQFEYLKADVNPTNAPPPLVWGLMRGSAVHEALEKAAPFLPHPVEIEVTYIDDENSISATIDILLRYGGGVKPVELKSCSAKSYRFLSKPYPRNIWQVQTQLLVSGLDEAFIYYVPTAEPESDSLPDLLRRAHKIAPAGSDIHSGLTKIVRSLPVLTEQDGNGGNVSGKVFPVARDESIIGKIRGMAKDVKDACGVGGWLDTNTSNCALCPFTKPCYGNATVAQVSRRE